jgi:thiol-disulfide isomerase/thioredoxin
MKHLAIGILITLLAACGSDADSSAANIIAQPGLKDLKGQWVLVNYWAQWCKHCIEEIPELNKLNESRKKLTVLGVNYEGASGEVLKEQETRLGVAFTTITDPSAELGIARPVVLPTTLLIDPAGRVVNQLVGPQTVESLEAAIEAAATSVDESVPGS